MTAPDRPRGQVLAAVERLRALTDEQIAAARSLRSAELSALNTRRTDALFALRIALQDNGVPTAAQDPTLREAVRQLTLAEKRLSAIAVTVLDRIAQLDRSSPAPTYDRSGRIG